MRNEKTAQARLVESIYAAAASPELWPDTLADVCDGIGAGGGMIVYHPRASQGFFVTGRLREDLNELYVKEHSVNPFTLAAPRLPKGEPLLSNAFVDMNFVRRTAMFADIWIPQRIESIIQTVHPSLSTNGGVGGFGFTLNVRQLDSASTAQRRLKRFLPHLGRALDMSLDIGRRLTVNHGLVETIAAMPGAALLLNEKGRIVFANVAAEYLLAENDGLTIRRADDWRLSAEDEQENAALAVAIRSSVQVATGIDAEWSGRVRVSRRSGKPALVVLLTPLTSPFHPFAAALPQTASVLVQILGGADLPQSRVAAFGEIYGLTEAEMRVAAVIGSGLSAPQAAAHLAVSLHTVKTHLRHCFDKTGVRSQVELTRLMALMPSHPSFSAEPISGAIGEPRIG
jgi:DNA-binding CsgD family transcriptional regulator/PAS domain-containing protein